MPTKTYAQLECPQCHASLTRVRRRADEKAEAARSSLRRYHCSAAACGWEGLLPRRVRKPRKMLVRRVLRQMRQATLPAVALSGFGFALAAAAWQAGLLSPQGARGYAPGEHHVGEPLPVAHALSRHHEQARLMKVSGSLPSASATTGSAKDASKDAANDAAVVSPTTEAPATAPAAGPEPLPAAIAAGTAASATSAAAVASDALALRYGCVWGEPGRSPYKGSVEQALRSAALPEEIVQAVAAQVRAGTPVDTLEVRNEGITAQASGRVFNAQNVALTYGRTLCLGARVNFKQGHVEKAALYEASTAGGRVIAVMVPEVCGNVSVLGQSDEDARNFQLANGANGNAEVAAGRFMPAVLESGVNMPLQGGGRGNEVPEPGTLACVLAALGALGLGRVLRARRR